MKGELKRPFHATLAAGARLSRPGAHGLPPATRKAGEVGAPCTMPSTPKPRICGGTSPARSWSAPTIPMGRPRPTSGMSACAWRLVRWNGTR